MQDNTELIEVKKYEVSLYTYDFFVGEPYNIIIRVSKSGYNDKLDIFSSDKPLDAFFKYMDEKITEEIYVVNITKKWVDECYELYKLTKKINESKNTLFQTVPDIKTPHDLYKEHFRMGLEFFSNDKEYDLALNEFNKCIKLKPTDINATYNIACCYSHKCDTENALKWLNIAVDNGALDYLCLESDKDLTFIKNTDGFSKIIERQILLNTHYNSH